MNIINYIKYLFHTHQYVYQKTTYQSVKEADFSGFGYNTWTEVYDVYKCKKCGKLVRKFIKVIE